ncbi:efflux transporter periplasmic adaptor subunit [Maritimibacter sp. 55A14]|uniref:efflux RND transporter periplasmic adaptor subunit n=1 Tax=Maritimibacter sp. 55A14 TaxID=2174844 RepID=UPI000D60ED1C|nr:efflux RND transporter periplasmic adaptor subunit [Maritimibacter sp. 55A14]PWE32598.1 efflux transporter periplasmic adaptor subunit [Maritimibacter sp. 55A14]
MAIWKQLLVLCLLGAAGFGGYSYYTEHMAPPAEATVGAGGPREVPVEIARAETRTLSRSVEAVGTTRARQSVEIVPEAAGRLVEILIEPGATVEAGDVLARLDDEIQRADLTEAEARLVEQRQALERIRRLRETNAVAQATLEEATARLAAASAELDRARRRMAERTIRAPFAGVVGLTDADLGARVDEDTMLTRLDDLSEIEVEFSLPETLFAGVRLGQELTAFSAAFPERDFVGRVAAYDSRIDPVSRSFKTRAVIPNPENLLPAGMFMSLTLVLSQSEALVVPEEAIVFQAADTYVFVVEDGKALRRKVVTGQRRDGVVAVTSGLTAGDAVVVRGLQRVRDGSPVRVLGDSAAVIGAAPADAAESDT